MDRFGQFGSPLLGSYSLPSLAEGSEAISEAEEINEVKSLHDRGVRAAKGSDFDEAIQFYNEALEIDSSDMNVLQARALAYLQKGNVSEAAQDAETMIMINPDSAQGHLLQGLAYQHMNMHKASLQSMLTALEFDSSSAEKITNHIAGTVSKFCHVPQELASSLRNMDPYVKMGEIGVILFQNKKYEASIQVLDAAKNFQTNQKGVTMKILLTQANAHSQLLHIDTAIQLYQECLSLALSTHEQVYQTKSLVNIATLHLENGDTHQAIIFYEKLLHLEAEILQERGQRPDSPTDSMPSYWTKELQCGLHLNLSIAYKTIGNMFSAVKHAKKYMSLAKEFGLKDKLVAESNHNTGMLQEILGNFQEALECYKQYLSMSKANGNQKGKAQAYGCLASVYAALHNWSLSLSYHEQYIATASKFKDKKMLAIAHEMMGDSLCRKGDYEQAIGHYNNMLMLCRSRDNKGDATSRCKIAAAYKSLGQLQYSLYYYNEALSLAQKFGLKEIETMCEFHIACINKDSTQYLERDAAQKYFMKLIPFFERKIAEHNEESSFCPEEYEHQLSKCYDGMQTVLSLMANKYGSLQYAEAHRKRQVVSLPNFQTTCRAGNHSLDSSREIWGTDHMKRVVSEQNATVMYYSLLDNFLLLWVLQPGEGVTRFYTGRSYSKISLSQEIKDLLVELNNGWSQIDLYNTSEARALPLKDANTQHIRAMNSRLSSAKPRAASAESKQENKKPPQRRLFDILVAPVIDILDKMEDDSHLVIIPDKHLNTCPFGALLDYRNKPLYERFNISVVSCLLLLDRVIQNELKLLSAADDLEFQRQQCRKGGLPEKIKEHSERMTARLSLILDESRSELDSKLFSPNRKTVSNPRLSSRGGIPAIGLKGRESTFLSMGGRSTLGIPTPVPEHKEPIKDMPKPSTVSLGFPTSLEHMLAAHTYTTLTTKTWTGTDVTSSRLVVPEFRQISDPRSILVFGAPTVKAEVQIHSKPWLPKTELFLSQCELSQVADCLGTHPVMGEHATRQELFNKLPNAEIVHISTWACLREGFLLVTPDSLNDESDDNSHLVTIADILNLQLRAKIVVLSTSGLSPARSNQENVFKLANCFLTAGAQCVLACLWPIPDDALCKFYFHFYDKLQQSSFLSAALKNGVKAIQDDDRFNHLKHWSCFTLIGKDGDLSINKTRHALLDQLIDKCEEEFEEESEKPLLNPRTVIPNVLSKEENLHQLQKHVAILIKGHFKHPSVIPDLIELLDAALKRLHTSDNNRQPFQLSNVVGGNPSALALLKWLGFHFQAKGAEVSEPYILFPHWNTDELLIPTYDALKATLDMTSSPACMSSLCDALPLSQDNLSCIIDLSFCQELRTMVNQTSNDKLYQITMENVEVPEKRHRRRKEMSITKHAPEIQLKVTDLSVHPLWHFTKTRALLSATGFHQVGLLLTFNMMSLHKQLLVSMLQLMLSISCHKSPVLLYRLDVNLLGRASDTKSSRPELTRLPSLTPLILPRNQLRMSTPWFSVIEDRDEMSEKMKLAKSTSNLSEEFLDYIERARTWHQTTVIAQANENLDKYGRPITMPKPKVKVISGATASQSRMPVDKEKTLSTPEVHQRRDYAHFILKERVNKINDKKKDGLMKLYMPHVKT